MESYRAVKSRSTSQQDKEALYEQLIFMYRNVTEAMKNLELNQSKSTLNQPISIRSCGFIIRNFVNRIVRLGILAIPEGRVLAASLYRIGLLQVDCKLEEARAMQSSRKLNTAAFEDTVITGDMRRALDMMPEYLPTRQRSALRAAFLLGIGTSPKQ